MSDNDLTRRDFVIAAGVATGAVVAAGAVVGAWVAGAGVGVAAVELHPTTATIATVARVASAGGTLNLFLIPCSSPIGVTGFPGPAVSESPAAS